MSELRQEQRNKAPVRSKEKLLAVQVSPTEVRYLTPGELEKSITQDDIQLGLNAAGAWGDLGLTEDELFEELDKIRHGSKPTPLIDHE